MRCGGRIGDALREGLEEAESAVARARDVADPGPIAERLVDLAWLQVDDRRVDLAEASLDEAERWIRKHAAEHAADARRLEARALEARGWALAAARDRDQRKLPDVAAPEGEDAAIEGHPIPWNEATVLLARARRIHAEDGRAPEAARCQLGMACSVLDATRDAESQHQAVWWMLRASLGATNAAGDGHGAALALYLLVSWSLTQDEEERLDLEEARDVFARHEDAVGEAACWSGIGRILDAWEGPGAAWPAYQAAIDIFGRLGAEPEARRLRRERALAALQLRDHAYVDAALQDLAEFQREAEAAGDLFESVVLLRARADWHLDAKEVDAARPLLDDALRRTFPEVERLEGREWLHAGGLLCDLLSSLQDACRKSGDRDGAERASTLWKMWYFELERVRRAFLRADQA